MRHVKVILSEQAYKETVEALDAFLQGQGVSLYRQLQEYNDSTGVENYLHSFWLQTYLDYKEPLVINVNPVFILEDDPSPIHISPSTSPSKKYLKQIRRTSSLLLSSLRFAMALKKETLMPDVWRNKPLCMSQFKNLFGTCRVPMPSGESDHISHDPASRHIVFIRKGQFYYFEGLNNDYDTFLTERELSKNIEVIIKDSDMVQGPREDSVRSIASSAAGYESVGVFTAQHRDRWARVRSQLLELDENNKKVLRIIDTALFVVCLDSDHAIAPSEDGYTAPRTVRASEQKSRLAPPAGSVSETVANSLHGSYVLEESTNAQFGTAVSRWYDKLQLIVSQSGQAGVNFEHSVVDGHTVLRFASDVFTDTIVRFAQTISGPQRVGSFMGKNGDRGAPGLASLPKLSAQWSKRAAKAVRKLQFTLDGELKAELKYAEARLGDSINRVSTEVLEFTGYGKLFIVQSHMSPDAFVQLAILMAYYQVYGTMVNTYESVLTKTYAQGRTEAARSASEEASLFIKAFLQYEKQRASARNKTGSSSNGTAVLTDQGQQTLDLLRKALKRHSETTKDASRGQGVDRLLYALKCMAKRTSSSGDLPRFFTSPGFRALCENTLSTSNCGNPSLRFFGFGPVCENGFGVGYIIKEDSMNFCVTSFQRQTKRFVHVLQAYLEDIQDLILDLEPKHFEESLTMHVQENGYGGIDGSLKISNSEERLNAAVVEDSMSTGYDFYGESENGNIQTNSASLPQAKSTDQQKEDCPDYRHGTVIR